MSTAIQELQIISSGGNNIFNTGNPHYLIPLYQREYAWKKEQIELLIDDINGIDNDTNYYIGSLIVHRRSDNLFEVIDGQQRLTTLYLLLNCLDDVKTLPNLTFECRERSNYSIVEIKEIIKKLRHVSHNLDEKKVEGNIEFGIGVILEHLKKIDVSAFKAKLAKVILYRIEVPPHTDLNRYFEIMNTRGEQLAQHDIIKANLMNDLQEGEREPFARIWDACSDMTGYVQMHFSTEDRRELFTPWWNKMPTDNTLGDYFKRFATPSSKNSTSSKKCTIADIIQLDNPPLQDFDGTNERDEHVRFESIIDFPHFLLHTLRVFVNIKGVQDTDLGLQLDDKKLKSDFDAVKNGTSNSTEPFALQFIKFLLQTRFLFDKFIIKRETSKGSDDGEWSLKTLYVSNSGKSSTAYYNNTSFQGNYERSTGDYHKECLMMQAALRVSYTSAKEMHWITNLLTKLTSQDITNHSQFPSHINWKGIEFIAFTEWLAAQRVQKHMLHPADWPNQGTATPHIIFNYLDYLLWKNDKTKYNDFTFEFRNSVEHWYPQHPSSDSFKRWDDVVTGSTVDRFGNLCLVQRNVNSKFSNLDPKGKKSSYPEAINKGSLKLRIMSEILDKCDAETWCTVKCEEHEGEMIAKLNSAINALSEIQGNNIGATP